MTQISALNPDVTLENVQSVLVEQFIQILGYQSAELSNWNPHDYE